MVPLDRNTPCSLDGQITRLSSERSGFKSQKGNIFLKVVIGMASDHAGPSHMDRVEPNQKIKIQRNY